LRKNIILRPYAINIKRGDRERKIIAFIPDRFIFQASRSADSFQILFHRVGKTGKHKIIDLLSAERSYSLLQITEWVRFVNFIITPQIVKLMHWQVNSLAAHLRCLRA